MTRLPDLEAWAIFAKVAETGSFSRTAAELGLSTPTVSKAVARLETRLGAMLFHRTSRQLSLSESGRASLARASRILAEGEAAEAEVNAQSAAPRGLVRMAAPMSFGVTHLGPALPDFCKRYPDVSLDLALSDELVDLVGGRFDLALRISSLADSSLLARRLCAVRVLLVGSPGYFQAHGRPKHPGDLTRHKALRYAYARSENVWHFSHRKQGDYAVTIDGPLRVNNSDVALPSLRAGVCLALQPEFLVWRDLKDGRLQTAMDEWRTPDIGIYIVTPPGTLRPKRVEVLIDFLAKRFAKAAWASAA